MRQKGFTLIEVIIALMIFAFAMMGLANMWSGSLMRLHKSAMFNDVATLLERKMAETEAKYKGKPFSEIPESESGDFEDLPNYRWELKSHDLKLPDMTPMITSQAEGADETLITMIKKVTEFLSKVIKEIKVTVYVKNHGKEAKFSAVTYMIDYSKEFGGL